MIMKKLLPFIFTFFIFAEPAFNLGCHFLGIERDGIVYKCYLASIAATVAAVYYFCNRNKKIDYITLFLFIIIFGLLYYLTSMFYGYPTRFHSAHFLRWVASCVPAVLMGVTLTYSFNKEKINKCLPFIVITLCPFIAFASLRGAQKYGQFTDEESGLNYQLISYYMAQLFAVSCYYLYISANRINNKIINILMYLMMAISGIVCIISGGRGGFVLLCMYLVVLLYIIYKRGYISKTNIFLLVGTSTILFLALANYFDLWDYAGFKRVIHPLAQQTGRKDDWLEVLTYFFNSPIYGNGLGSDFYTWGFYSHNIVVDLLAETGVIGLGLFGYLFFWTIRTIYRQSQVDDFYVLVLIIAMYGLIMNCFSGYWISAWPNWFAFGVAFGLRCQRIIGEDYSNIFFDEKNKKQ